MGKGQNLEKIFFQETLYNSYYFQSLSIDSVIYRGKSEFQEIFIFKNNFFGTVLALDGVIQTTERDEFIYHEMITHIPLLSHPSPEKVLIIGGGDGGVLRETLKHKSVQSVTLVEIDGLVVDLCKKFLPFISKNAYDDKKVNLLIEDGISFIKNKCSEYDVIIIDSTDPVGPGKKLFSKSFYSNCVRALKKNGCIVTQNGVPFFQLNEAKNSLCNLKPLINSFSFFSASIPTYVGGLMLFGIGSKSLDFSEYINIENLNKKFNSSPFPTLFYTTKIHISSFCLPKFIENL